MFSRTVTVDGKTYEISCCPDTPYSEILRRAAARAKAEEDAAFAEYCSKPHVYEYSAYDA